MGIVNYLWKKWQGNYVCSYVEEAFKVLDESQLYNHIFTMLWYEKYWSDWKHMRKRKIVNNTFKIELFFDMRNENQLISNAKNKKENEEVIYKKRKNQQ